jgi:hypothetical protein
MKIELDKSALITLVNGIEPYYSLFDNQIVSSCGSFSGSQGTWSWNKSNLKELSEEELYTLYLLCKDSWEGL